MPIDRDIIVFGFTIPVLLVLAFTLASWRPWATMRYELYDADETTRDPKHRLPRGWWGGALGLGIAAGVAHFGVAPKLSIPPVASYDWRFVATVGITLFALLVAVVRIPLAALLVLRLLISGAAVTGVVWRRFVNEQWDIGEGTLRIAGLALAITVFWSMLESIASRLRGATPVIIIAGLCLASAPLLIFDAAYGSVGNGAVALAISLVPVIALAWLRKPVSIARGGVAVVSLVLGLLWADAVVWQGGINAWQGAAYLLAPIGALVWLAPWVRSRKPLLRSVLTIGTVALLPTIATLETLSRVNWKEYGIDLPQIRGGGDEAESEDEYEYIW